MRGFKHYQSNAFDFHKAVVARKRDELYKQRLTILEPVLIGLFSNYDESFTNDGLTRMVSHVGFTQDDIEDFNELYSFQSKPMQDLRKEITTDAHKRTINTCQNCTINEVNSFDHLLPQSEFPEFIVNPKNLFPSCTKCNGHKNNAWRNGFIGNFLNLYIDVLPQVQYLFVDLNVSPNPNGLIETHFEVRNTGGIEVNLYNRIKSHYDRLDLCKRFSLNNNNVITELISTFKFGKDKNETRIQTVNASNENRLSFGYNHWKDILKIELANNVNFLARFP